MLPMPLTSDWSSRARLTPAAAAFSRRDDRGSSHSGSSGSRAMCAIGSGTPSVASSVGEGHGPPKVRWSTKRSSGPSVGEPEPGVQVLLVRARPAARTSSWPLMPRCTSRPWSCPSGASRTSQRYLPRRRGGRPRPASRAAKSAAPGTCRRTHAGAVDLGRRDPAADDVGVEAAADDLDLGQLGHTGPRRDQASALVGALTRPWARGPGWAGRRWSQPAQAGSAACCSASFLLRPAPCPRTSRRRPRSAANVLLVVRAGLGRRGTRAPRGAAAPSAPAGWSSSPGRRRGSPTGVISGSKSRWTHGRGGSQPAGRGRRRRSRASRVSARIEALSRPPVASSPRPRRTNSPRPRSRATSASARMLTTAARSLASWPSGRSGWVR